MDHTHHFDALAAAGPLAATPFLAVAAALFVTGLVGGFGHCAGMCGPFVLVQLRPTAGGTLRRLAGLILLPYHLGRALTYSLLGGVAGAFGTALLKTPALHWLAAAVLLATAIILALRSLAVPVPTPPLGKALGGVLVKVTAPLLRGGGAWRGFPLGFALGFLPCGFLYATLAAAAMAGGPLEGALAMLAFAAGTVPALVAVALAARAASARWRGLATRLVRPVLFADAVLLAFLAAQAVGTA